MDYQVVARRYRPKKFTEVYGQEPIVQTLKNALKYNRLAHAYLFSGSRGTGKTTLARIFAKALSCERLGADFEPCCSCPSCLEIAAANSIDVLEIDGASHRGIDDIRIITESVGYAPTKCRYKIYIIDEVHMLTKEAFNALLKTLEEPPEKVKFFFATTEPNKVPQTIISRCQRFHLRRIPLTHIISKLRYIANDMGLQIEDEAIARIARYAEGGLRDAESLFDQVTAFAQGKVTADLVYEVLGVMPETYFFELDAAFNNYDIKKAMQIASDVFLQGKDVGYFLQDLEHHYRRILYTKLSCNDLLEHGLFEQIERLKTSAQFYSQEQCLTILHLLADVQNNMRGALSERITLEAALLRIFQEKQRLPIEYIVRRLHELEKAVVTPASLISQPLVSKPLVPEPTDARLEILPSLAAKPKEASPKHTSPPTPQPSPPPPATPTPIAAAPNTKEEMQKKSRYDTLMQFAAVELNGALHKK